MKASYLLAGETDVKLRKIIIIDSNHELLNFYSILFEF